MLINSRIIKMQFIDSCVSIPLFVSELSHKIKLNQRKNK